MSNKLVDLTPDEAFSIGIDTALQSARKKDKSWLIDQVKILQGAPIKNRRKYTIGMLFQEELNKYTKNRLLYGTPMDTGMVGEAH